MTSIPHPFHRGRRSSAVLALAALTVLAGCNRDPNVRKQKYLESGQRYATQGKYREANIQYFNALKVDKDFSAAHYELSKTYLKMNLPNEAYAELLRTVRTAPGNIPAHVDLAHLLLAAREYGKAAEEGKAILALHANNADGYAILANAAIAKGRLDEATTDIEKAIALDPNRSEFHSILGYLKSSGNKDQKGAREQFENAIRLNPKDAGAHLGLAGLLETGNDLQAAEAEYRAAIAVAPQNLQARTSLIGFYTRRQDTGKVEAAEIQAANDFADDLNGAGMLERYYLRTGRQEKIAPAYAKLAADHKKSFPILVLYARQLAQQGNFSQANSILSGLLKEHSSEPLFAQTKAALLVHDGKKDEAVKLLQESVRSNPEDAANHVLLGRVLLDKGELTTAESNFREALRLQPSNIDAAAAIVELDGRKGNLTELRQLAAQMAKFYPQAPQPLLWRATADANEGHLDEASSGLLAALKLQPGNAHAMATLGEVRLKQGKSAEARELFQKSLAADPNSPALTMLVRMNLQANKPQEALALLQQQIARNPSSSTLYTQLAAAQLATNDIQAAVNSTQKALQLDGGNVAAARIYTQASLQQNNLNGPTAFWEKWAAGHPLDPQAPAFLGMLSESAGEPAKAIAYYQKSLQIQPEQPVMQNNLAFLMVESGGNADVALSLAQSAHRAMPKSPSTADTLAWVYYQKGVYNSALDLLQEAARADPDSASVQYHLGMTYAKLNRKDAATASFQRAVTLARGSDTGKKAQAALGRLG